MSREQGDRSRDVRDPVPLLLGPLRSDWIGDATPSSSACLRGVPPYHDGSHARFPPWFAPPTRTSHPNPSRRGKETSKWKARKPDQDGQVRFRPNGWLGADLVVYCQAE